MLAHDPSQHCPPFLYPGIVRSAVTILWLRIMLVEGLQCGFVHDVEVQFVELHADGLAGGSIEIGRRSSLSLHSFHLLLAGGSIEIDHRLP